MDKISYYIWIIATFMLISCGIFYTIKLKFPQFKFKRMLKSINDNNRNKSGISPFESLTLALASRVGVGSLSGIALSIYRGGIGTIFWIWVSCLLILPNAFVESTVDSLINEFPLLEYFNTYLTDHLGHDLETFDGAIKNPDTKTELVKLRD